LFKHYDMYFGGNTSRRARELVIGFVTTVSNYDYGIRWVFRQDGSIEIETELTGIMLAKGSKHTTMQHAHDGMFGHLVAPYVIAPHHQHFFNFRLDLDVDGADNSVVELNAAPIDSEKDNPGRNAFVMTETPLANEQSAQRDLSLKAQRKWKIYNPARKNSLGYPSGYILIPGESSLPYLQADSPLRRRGGFVNHPVWITQQRDDELYAAGTYPSQRASADGLPVWTQQNRSLVGRDLVLWYTFGVTHAPRPEEWPVMPVHRTSFKLIPAGFFDRNPALDVP
jgi:primary-amine oxidase